MTTITYEFAELGEGYGGEYNPDDPHDTELLRLDVCEDGEEIASLCTNLPTSLTDEERQQALNMVAQFAVDHDVSPDTITEVFSHADPSWLKHGVSATILRLFNLS